MVFFPNTAKYYLQQSSFLTVVQSLLKLVTSLEDTRVALISSSDPDLTMLDFYPELAELGIRDWVEKKKKLYPSQAGREHLLGLNNSYFKFATAERETTQFEKSSQLMNILPVSLLKSWLPGHLNIRQLLEVGSSSGNKLAERVAILGIGDRLNVLLSAVKVFTGSEAHSDSSAIPKYQIDLVFDVAQISSFCREIENQLIVTPEIMSGFQQAITGWTAQPNLPTLQSEFMLQMLTALDRGNRGKQLEMEFRSIELVNLDRQVAAQTKQLAILNRLGSQIRASVELSQIWETVTIEVGHLLSTDCCAILQYSEEEKVWKSCTEYSAHPDLPSAIKLFVADENRPLLSALNNLEIVRIGDPHSPNHTNYPNSGLLVPIHYQEKIWGCLACFQNRSSHYWQESELKFLTTVADQVAIAIYQSALQQQIQQQNHNLKVQIQTNTISPVKKEFLTFMSHELRTPLTSVIGMSSALLHQHFGQLNPKQAEYLQIIHGSGQHLLHLINDILDVSKIESGKASLTISKFCLREVASSCVAVLREKAERKKIKLIEELADLCNTKDFYGDERRVKQILLNLLSNAVKFTPSGGQVCLRIESDGQTAKIEVADTGIGISAEKQHLVFEPFEQLDSEQEGTGLGLVLTRQLVEMHGGTIGFISNVGVGTIFTVFIAAQPQPPQEEDVLD